MEMGFWFYCYWAATAICKLTSRCQNPSSMTRMRSARPAIVFEHQNGDQKGAVRAFDRNLVDSAKLVKNLE